MAAPAVQPPPCVPQVVPTNVPQTARVNVPTSFQVASVHRSGWVADVEVLRPGASEWA